MFLRSCSCLGSLFPYEKWTQSIYSSPVRRHGEEAALERMQRRYIVLDVVASEGNTTPTYHTADYKECQSESVGSVPDLKSYEVVVAKDVMRSLFPHCWMDPSWREFLGRRGKVWDTSFAEYLLGGQNVPRGVLPKATAKETRDVFLSQLSRAAKSCQVISLEARSDILLCTAEMEYRGIHVDAVALEKAMGTSETDLMEQRTLTEHYLPRSLHSPTMFSFQWTNNDHLATLYFGGKLLGSSITLPSRARKFFPDPEEYDEFFLRTDTKSTPEVTVELLDMFAVRGCALSQTVKRLLLAKYAKASLKGASMSLKKTTCTVHPTFHCSQTVTGRLSQSSPCMQNIPKNQRYVLTSRFGPEEGRMLEADYQQLEVITQCALTRDPQMIRDLADKIDFHCKRVCMMRPDLLYRKVYQKAKVEKDKEFVALRQAAKIFSFQRQYGASAKTISGSANMHIKDVQRLMKAENEMYKNVEPFFEMVEKSLHQSPQNTFQLQTGTKFVIVPNGHHRNLVRNYPVQGFAAEIISVMLGKVFRHFLQTQNYNDKAFLVNTVHDSVWIDCHRSVVAIVAKDVSDILKAVPQTFKELYPGMEVCVDFPVDVAVGPNLTELKEVT